jgi:hypothetical protein
MTKRADRELIAAKAAGALSVNTAQVSEIISYALKKRMRDLNKVTRIRLECLPNEKGDDYCHGPQKSDDVQMQMLWMWNAMRQEAAEIADPESRLNKKISIMANMTSLVNSIQELAGDAFKEGMDLLRYEIQRKEAEGSGKPSANDLTDAQLVELVAKGKG